MGKFVKVTDTTTTVYGKALEVIIVLIYTLYAKRLYTIVWSLGTNSIPVVR